MALSSQELEPPPNPGRFNWVIGFGKLARRSVAFKALYEKRRNKLIDCALNQYRREGQWYEWYG